MNLFLYKASVVEINNVKYAKDANKLARKYTAILNNTGIGNYYKSVTKYSNEQSIWIYKLTRLATNKFYSISKATLPNFIHDTLTSSVRAILRSYLELDLDSRGVRVYSNPLGLYEKPTYDQFIDTFEFDKTIIINRGVDLIEVLNDIIGDKPIHFTIEFNNYLSNFDTYSTNLTSNQQLLVYAIRYKQVHFPNKPQTVWDLLIEEYTAICIRNNNIPIITDEVIKLEQQIKAVKETQQLLSNLPKEK